MLGQYGEILTEHIAHPYLTAQGEPIPSKAIHNRDIKWMNESDVIVAEVTTPSLGVGYELRAAVEMQKPTLCLFRPATGRSLSSMIAGNSFFTIYEYNSPNELAQIFESFFKKLKKDQIA